jgi:hypothetical protein
MLCRVEREDDARIVAHHAIDLSPDGMLVLAGDASAAPGERMVVSFRATPFDIWFDTVASVERFVYGRRPGDRGPAMGLRFETLSAVQRHILRGHLRKIPPPIPKRAQPIDYAATLGRILYG